MNARSHLQRLTPWLWGSLAAIMAALIAAAGLPITPALFIPVALLLLAFLVAIACISALLAVRYRALFGHWYAWAALVAACAIGGIVMQCGGRSQISGVQLFGTSLLIATTVALLTALMVMLKQHDIGFLVAGIVSLACIWGAVIAWRVRGDLLGEMLGNLISTSTEIPPTFWLNYSWGLSFCCVIPLALLSVLFHTGVQINRELQTQDLPVTKTGAQNVDAKSG